MIRDFKEPIKLNLGSGETPIPGYISIDHRNIPGCTDILDDIRYLRRFKNKSVEVIYCCATLEHFSKFEIPNMLKRWHELLKPGGVCRISVPDFDKLVMHYQKYHDLLILMGMCMGGGDYDSNHHKILFNFKILTGYLYEAGFKRVEKYNWWETEHANIDDFSQSYLPHMVKDKEEKKSTLMHLNVEAYKER